MQIPADMWTPLLCHRMTLIINNSCAPCPELRGRTVNSIQIVPWYVNVIKHFGAYMQIHLHFLYSCQFLNISFVCN